MTNFVLALNYQRAQFIAREYGLERGWKFIGSTELSRGHEHPTVLRAGSFYERYDAREIELALAPCKPNYIEIRAH